jgi:hypothetical protein
VTNYQSGVLWLGLGLIIMRLLFTDQWSGLWSVLKTSSSDPSLSAGNTSTGSTAVKAATKGVNDVSGGGTGNPVKNALNQTLNGIIPGSGTIAGHLGA